jgi:hypothetical protein
MLAKKLHEKNKIIIYSLVVYNQKEDLFHFTKPNWIKDLSEEASKNIIFKRVP